MEYKIKEPITVKKLIDAEPCNDRCEHNYAWR